MVKKKEDNELEKFRKAIKKKLDCLPLHPHQRLSIPPNKTGQDITSEVLTLEVTAEKFLSKKKN